MKLTYDELLFLKNVLSTTPAWLRHTGDLRRKVEYALSEVVETEMRRAEPVEFRQDAVVAPASTIEETP